MVIIYYQGYRESAGFLLRAADQLEAMLANKENSN